MPALHPLDDPSEPAGDWLTGLPDRGRCHARLATLLAGSHDSGYPVTVVWIDIDRFRQINNSFGYLVGDGVLAELARRLARAAPAQASLARVGSDEFALLLGSASLHESERIGQKIVNAINRPLVIGTTRMRPSASVGIAVALPEESAHELMERAERAKMEAKRAGGGRHFIAPDGNLPARGGKYLAREELMVEDALHRALEIGGLYLDYQPIVAIPDGRVLSAEALMRCTLDGQVMAPGRFIPVAEKTGLISHLGDWSLITVAGCISRLQARGLSLPVAVNVSRVQLQNPTFAKSLHGVLACTGIEPARLELEITESLFMDHSDVVRDNLRAALAAGFTIALDDFGTGYSSLSCLKDLVVGKIKLDRSFVVDLATDLRAQGVARAVAHLAADLGIQVVAEGVESAEQLRLLGEAGVDAVQGYHIARPMSEASLVDWISP